MKNFKADKITRKHITVLLLAFVMMSVFLLPGCSNENKNEIITSIDQLAEPGRRIGVAADTSEGQLVEAQFPNADVKYYKDDMSAYVSVAQGKIDAFIFNKVSMESALRNGLSGVHLLDENFGEGNKGAVAFSPVTKIPDLENKVNTFIRELKSNGTLDDMKERWLIEQNEEMPDIDVPLVSDTHLVVGTTGTNMPFTYYIGTEIGGYDIELANRFAAWLGATIEYKIYDYDGIVAAAQSGDIDCIFANLFITPERLEAIKFSEPTFEGEIGVMVSNEGIASTDEKESSSVTIPKASDYAEKRIAVMTGTNFPEIVTKVYPKAEQYYFNTVADMISALGSGKVDAIAMDEPVARSVAAETGSTDIAEGYLESFDYAFLLPKTDKGKTLCDEISAYIKKLKDDETLKELQDKWFDSVPTESMMSVDPGKLPDVNGKIDVATLQYPPFTMQSEDMFFGYDVEILALFAKEKGYAIEFTDMNPDAIIPAVQTSKCDIAASASAITEERKETMLFAEPDYSGGVVLVVKKNESENGTSFFQNVKESFEKTFIRENRYLLFLRGIVVTILITVLSAIFGTVLGFMIFLACRKGNKVANKLANIFKWLMSGMPVVVLLMILYYIVFENVSISGAAVSIIGFTLVFAAEIYGLISTAVQAVDSGQMEAAYALGYTDRKAFFRLILPQAIPHFMPGFRGGLISLIKSTAIVGYVAVQDLTKMGDIVRSRTYDAFFPLIAVAIIYFILAAILIFVVNRITLKMDPTRRNEDDILKGINTDDRTC